MKGNVKVVRQLNAVLTRELTAIDQYFLHAGMFDHWGLTKLGAYERKASIDEMKHAESMIARILFLEGLPNLQNLHKLLIGENVKIAGDYVSRDLLRNILASEEDHIDWLERQIELIGKIGIANYQQSQMDPGE